MESTYAQAARAKKVGAFVRYLDRRFVSVGRDPIRDAGEIAVMLRDSISEDQWRHHAVQAGQRPPSATTVAEIISVYELRAESFNDEPLRLQSGLVH